MPDLMCDTMNTTAPPPTFEPPTDADLAAIREQIVGTKVPIPQLALALSVSERSIYNLIDRHRIPFVKLLNKRLVEPADIKSAMLRDQSNAPQRGRGRPRKAS